MWSKGDGGALNRSHCYGNSFQTARRWNSKVTQTIPFPTVNEQVTFPPCSLLYMSLNTWCALMLYVLTDFCIKVHNKHPSLTDLWAPQREKQCLCRTKRAAADYVVAHRVLLLVCDLPVCQHHQYWAPHKATHSWSYNKLTLLQK